jgi:hypothetical protein
MILDGNIIDRFEEGSWFAREISDLHEDIFFFFHVEIFPIDHLDQRELLVHAFSIVFFEVGIEYFSPLFYEKIAFFSIDELTDMGSCFFCLYE